MTQEEIHNLDSRMEHRGIRPTAIRSLILRTLAEASAPMSVQDIEIELDTVDRSSVSRAMASFQKAGLVHLISDGSSTVKYELCRRDHPHSPSDEHVHFRCEICGKTICLPGIPIPEVKLPEGFRSMKSNFVISGVCDKCQSRSKAEE